jgi:hypothetical protein
MRFYLFLILTIIGCSPDTKNIELDHFNDLAGEFVLRNFEEYDLGYLEDFERCILKETIANDLDELNDWRTVTIDDKFQVRNYHAQYLDLDFAIIRCGEHFSLVTLPDVANFVYDIRRYYQEQGEGWILKDSSAVFSINSDLLNQFLNDSTSAIKEQSSLEKAMLLNRLIPEIFYSPFFRSISLYQFKDMIDEQINTGEIRNDDYSKVRKLIESIHPSVVNLCTVFFMERVGWVLLNYPEENLEGNKVNVDAYFIAVRKRNSIVHGEEHIKYSNCL